MRRKTMGGLKAFEKRPKPGKRRLAVGDQPKSPRRYPFDKAREALLSDVQKDVAWPEASRAYDEGY